MTSSPASETVAAGLSEGEKSILVHPRFNPKGWEPRNPFTPSLSRMIEMGLFRRADGRCGFEAFKDSFVIPTELGLAVVALLQGSSK